MSNFLTFMVVVLPFDHAMVTEDIWYMVFSNSSADSKTSRVSAWAHVNTNPAPLAREMLCTSCSTQGFQEEGSSSPFLTQSEYLLSQVFQTLWLFIKYQMRFTAALLRHPS